MDFAGGKVLDNIFVPPFYFRPTENAVGKKRQRKTGKKQGFW